MPFKRDQKQKFRIAGICLIFVAILTAGWFFRHRIAENTRSWRSAHNLGRAIHSGEESEWEDAYKYALVARQLNPTSVEALRVLVNAAFQARSPRTLDYANALFLSAKAERGDKLQVLSILQQAKDHVGFVRLYNLLSRDVRQEKEFIILRVQFLIERNAFDTAREILEAQIAENRDRQYLLLLATLLIQPSSNAKDMARGQQIIAELAASEDADEVAKTAFQLLGFIDPDRIRPDLLGDLGMRADRSAAGTPADYIAAASLALAAAGTPEEREAILKKAIEDQGGIAPALLANWMQRINQPEAVLNLLAEDVGRRSPDLYLHRLNALVNAGLADKAREWLSTPPAGMPAVDIWMARARLARLQGVEAEENNSWEQAFRAAETTAERNEYLKIFEVAQASDRVDLATRALLKAPSHPTGILPPAADATAPMMFLTRNNRLEDLKFLTEAFVAREPENVVLLNNLIYLNLLLGEKIDACIDGVTELIRLRPALLSLRTTHAMALLMKERNAEALETLPNDPAQWSRAASTDADRAIYAATLDRNGKTAEARDIWSKVDLKALTEVERAIFFPPEPDEKSRKTPTASP